MHIFDRVDPQELETREWQLWLLALSILFIFALGIALLMYPAAFSSPIALMVTSPRETFFGFCALAILAIGYLADRQLLISRLRKKSAGE
jgi:hypothetical protein